MNWVINNVPNVCSPTQADHFTCPKATVFFNASIIWGVIGPQRIFAIGKIYSDTLWFFLLGALLPIPIWLWVRKRPKHWLRYMHVPLIMGGLGMIPPATPMNYISWALVKYHFRPCKRLTASFHLQFSPQAKMARMVDKVQFCVGLRFHAFE